MMETDLTIAVGKLYLHELQADAARWRYVREHLAWQNLMGTWGFDFIVNRQNYRESLDEAIDRLIEEAKREGKG